MKSSRSFVERYLKKLSGWIIIALICFFGALYIFGVILEEVVFDKDHEFDEEVFTNLAGFVRPQLTSVMKTITYCASSTFLQIGYGILAVAFLLNKNWKRAVEISVIGLGGFAINYLMKIYFQRSRPSDPLIDPLHNFSFPSGHATSGFIFYGLLVYLLFKTEIKRAYKIALGSILMLFAILIGFSRVYLRVHYLTDVIAGFCVGFAWLVLAIYIMERLKKKSSREERLAEQ